MTGFSIIFFFFVHTSISYFYYKLLCIYSSINLYIYPSNFLLVFTNLFLLSVTSLLKSYSLSLLIFFFRPLNVMEWWKDAFFYFPPSFHFLFPSFRPHLSIFISVLFRFHLAFPYFFPLAIVPIRLLNVQNVCVSFFFFFLH